MDKPEPNPKALLDHWMEWEEGVTTPGMVLKNLKIGGLDVLLKSLAEES